MITLLPKFLFISNSLQEKNRDAVIISGNERVLKARLSDANFFWNADKSKSFENWNDKLKKVQFHEGLGSLHDKTKRMSKTSPFFFKTIPGQSRFCERGSYIIES